MILIYFIQVYLKYGVICGYYIISGRFKSKETDFVGFIKKARLM